MKAATRPTFHVEHVRPRHRDGLPRSAPGAPAHRRPSFFPISDDVLTAARRACDETGALHVFDEVQCGMPGRGRCGPTSNSHPLPSDPIASRPTRGFVAGGRCARRRRPILRPVTGARTRENPILNRPADPLTCVSSWERSWRDVGRRPWPARGPAGGEGDSGATSPPPLRRAATWDGHGEC